MPFMHQSETSCSALSGKMVKIDFTQGWRGLRVFLEM